MTQKYKVSFLPDNRTVEVAQGTSVLSAAITAGIYVNSSCGGEGVCGRCKVVVSKGKVLSRSSGHLTAEERGRGVYLACETQVASDCEVLIPPESRLSLDGLTREEVLQRLKNEYSDSEEVQSFGEAAAPAAFGPLVRKVALTLPAPTLEDKVSDLERVQRELMRTACVCAGYASLATLKGLGELLRSAQWEVTVTIGMRSGLWDMLFIEAGNTASRNYGLVFDIGTTTLSGQLVDLVTGTVLGTKATYNKQAVFGSDVITRIIYAKDSDGLEELHRAVVEDMNGMAQEMAAEHSVDPNDITCCVASGNTTMTHLLLRVDPSYIRRDPYVPVLNSVPVMRASDISLRINPRGLLYCLPGVASYVGGDVTAGVLSSGLARRPGLSVLIDIGTNGEVVVGNSEFMIACAASAGPAFEGSGVRCGMRAARGALQDIAVDPATLEPSFTVIGGERPLGICGSGYIDLIAALRRAGGLDKGGKFDERSHPRLRGTDEGKEYVLVWAKDSGTHKDIVISETDIENLKRAKAAIYAGVSILIRHLGLSFSQVETFFVAGGFGTYVNMDNAISIGLLPDLPREKFAFIGNSSLAGSRMAALSLEGWNFADELARKMTYLELSVEPAYMDEYMAAMFFPHTDLTLFPSVKH
jgi:uncharacterized 2Fe-2S/4Fe-4S cluster protein (DUF4445 family)